jgi:rod shape determining protein RodA
MLRIDRRLVAHFEWPILLFALGVVGCGLLTILSATYNGAELVSPFVLRQGTSVVLGLGLLIAALAVDYRTLNRHAYAIYALSLLSLILVPLIGASGGGARRWLSIGPLSLQPSEFMKIGLVIALARHLQRPTEGGRLALRNLVAPILLLAGPAILVLKQPDLGTVIVFAMVVFTILLLAGLPLRIVFLAIAIVGPAMPYGWKMLKPYQQQRLMSFIDPQADPLGAGYHVRQSQIAIGSGQAYGKGYLRGTQNQLNFLPEQHTDFIFSVYAEEWGFVGAAVLVALYSLVILRGLFIASRARDNVGALLAAGLTGIIFWQVVINVAMTSGSLPVVGITLPFFSYGGSSMMALMAAIGLIMNVSMRRYTF